MVPTSIFLYIIIIYSFLLVWFLIRRFQIKEKILLKELYTDLGDQIETINALLNLIDNQISVEVSYLLREEITLNKVYNPINIDKDCTKIASEIYESLEPNLILGMEKVNHIYNKNFWMKYIVKQTTVQMLNTYIMTKKG